MMPGGPRVLLSQRVASRRWSASPKSLSERGATTRRIRNRRLVDLAYGGRLRSAHRRWPRSSNPGKFDDWGPGAASRALSTMEAPAKFVEWMRERYPKAKFVGPTIPPGLPLFCSSRPLLQRCKVNRGWPWHPSAEYPRSSPAHPAMGGSAPFRAWR